MASHLANGQTHVLPTNPSNRTEMFSTMTSIEGNSDHKVNKTVLAKLTFHFVAEFAIESARLYAQRQKFCLHFNQAAEVCFIFMHSTDILKYICQYVQPL